jgi:hypothetical protein
LRIYESIVFFYSKSLLRSFAFDVIHFPNIPIAHTHSHHICIFTHPPSINSVLLPCHSTRHSFITCYFYQPHLTHSFAPCFQTGHFCHLILPTYVLSIFPLTTPSFPPLFPSSLFALFSHFLHND